MRVAEAVIAKHVPPPPAPPVDIERIAVALGFQVVRLFSPSGEFSGIVSPRQRLIGVNGNHHIHRQRFTIAHELAHIVLNHPPESRCSTRETAGFNREADVCASELLIPTELLMPHLAGSVCRLSRLFNVSEDAMTRKVQMLAHIASLADTP
jgi:Zn-dependent peptidase ImmA (M78 family)